MSERHPGSITILLDAVARGDRGALDELWDRVQDELRAIADGKRAREQRGDAMSPSVLVNEAFLRLFGGKPVRFESRKHFFCYAAKVMTNLLIDDGRKRKPLVPIDRVSAIYNMPPEELRALRECLDRLEAIRPRAAHVVRLRFISDRTVQETAQYLGKSDRTVEGDWQFARAWLHRCIHKGDTTTGGAGWTLAAS
jgi:RNA polymerase sigma factor (TIGR02999 family)